MLLLRGVARGAGGVVRGAVRAGAGAGAGCGRSEGAMLFAVGAVALGVGVTSCGAGFWELQRVDEMEAHGERFGRRQVLSAVSQMARDDFEESDVALRWREARSLYQVARAWAGFVSGGEGSVCGVGERVCAFAAVQSCQGRPSRSARRSCARLCGC
jgi:hypothetical protein